MGRGDPRGGLIHSATTDALLDAFPKLLTLPIRQLQSSVVNASYLQELLAPDLAGSMLAWIDDPVGFRTRAGDGHWKAFAGQARKTLDLNPDKEGELTAARRLGEADGAWSDVWARYAGEPEKYPAIEGRLRKAKPAGTLFDQAQEETWPQDNDAEEAQLRKALDDLKDSTANQARAAIDTL